MTVREEMDFEKNKKLENSSTYFILALLFVVVLIFFWKM
jgi:hypothetical protein